MVNNITVPLTVKSLARAISYIENEAEGWEKFMEHLPPGDTPVIGITGAPGAGKSSLTDALIGWLSRQQKKLAILCVDPSSPFNKGALLGDRFRMQRWFTNPNIFIRSLASRGSLGGLHPRTLEITDLLKRAGFDYVIVETVGVGQSEIEIAGLSDCTVLVLVPEGGDDIQAMKSGIMEAADVVVVNKADRPGADTMVQQVKQMQAFNPRQTPVIKTIATQGEGMHDLMDAIHQQVSEKNNPLRKFLLAEKAWKILSDREMEKYNKEEILMQIESQLDDPNFNIYQLVQHVLNNKT